jgi:predicted transcriptional regulator
LEDSGRTRQPLNYRPHPNTRPGHFLVATVCTDALFRAATGEVEVDAETLAAIDRGINDADEGRTIPIDEVRKMIPKWISRFELQKPR